jgi:hypothetical protein
MACPCYVQAMIRTDAALTQLDIDRKDALHASTKSTDR